jgi:hypothetical protein
MFFLEKDGIKALGRRFERQFTGIIMIDECLPLGVYAKGLTLIH